jgi:Putative papain-like cysteine peptidase (DUF1796)
LGLLKENEKQLRIVNEADHEFNLHPMWKEVRRALKALPSGVYHDPAQPNASFRTLLVGRDGLESRVKIPAKSSVLFQFHSALSELKRVAILPLGDRCAIRMLLYKLEYDGPAFPFDLTRTTRLADIADMIARGFENMWNPDLLYFDPDQYRIYHTQWEGLSFAHEIEETENPTEDMFPVFERMRKRYQARATRFWYTIQHCDRALFIRTGVASRGDVRNLVDKLSIRCQGKPFHVLILSPQSSAEFAGLAHVLHYPQDFDPGRMAEDDTYWLACTEALRGILDAVGVSSKNLFWCPPTPPKG